MLNTRQIFSCLHYPATKKLQLMNFTIGTVVNDPCMYNLMQNSFLAAGFNDGCDYVIANNLGNNKYDMFSGGNFILSEAKQDYVILVHQDVRANFDTRANLETKIEELDEIDPTWAVAGNAGTNVNNEWRVRISDPYGDNWKTGNFPEKVTMLDGNFLLVKRNSLVAFSRDLSGFHYYGWDLCLNADVRGYAAYIIDWHLSHLGSGIVGPEFYACKDMFTNKWTRAFRKRIIGAWDHDRVTIGKEGTS
jgi:hypothetical protein